MSFLLLPVKGWRKPKPETTTLLSVLGRVITVINNKARPLKEKEIKRRERRKENGGENNFLSQKKSDKSRSNSRRKHSR